MDKLLIQPGMALPDEETDLYRPSSPKSAPQSSAYAFQGSTCYLDGLCVL
jgi:hypothetical protein